MESILSDGRLYLCGDSISAADIAFASMAFPVILPEETDSVFVAYDPRSLPRGYVEVIKRCGSSMWCEKCLGTSQVTMGAKNEVAELVKWRDIEQLP